MTDLDALERELSPEDHALLDELADALVARRLATAALFFVESIRPLGWLGSQLMVFLRPMVSVIWLDPRRWDQVQRMLEIRGSTELLARKLESRM